MSSAARRGLFCLALLAIVAAYIALARTAADAPAVSDAAVTETYTLLASQGRLLLGAYSRFQWHHPGPLAFYLLAPFYVASGHRPAGLDAGAAAIAIGSIALIVAVLRRREPLLAILGAAALALFAWRAAEAVSSPWNPHVAVLPLCAAVVGAADVLAGNAVLLPLVAALASLAGQSHIALMPTALAVGAVALVGALHRAAHDLDRRRWRISIAGAIAVLGLVWALPVYEQFTGTPHGNLTELWQFFRHGPSRGQPFSVAVSAWSDMFVGVLRPDFYVAHGWPFVESPVRWAEWLSVAELAVVGLYTAREFRRGNRFKAALGSLVILSSAVALWSTTRISEQIFDHDVFWIAGPGLLAAVITLDCGLTIARRGNVVVAPVTCTVFCAGLVGVAAWVGVTRLEAIASASANPSPQERMARALADDLAAFMDREHCQRPLVEIDQDTWEVTAGAILDLQKRGRIVSVEDDWVVMFSPEFRVNGREDATIRVVAAAAHLQLVERGAPVISAHDPVYAHLDSSR